MKIIQIMDNLITAGGVNSFVYDLCIAFKEAGQDIALIGIIGDQGEVEKQATAVRESGVPVHCLCMKSKKQALAIGIPKLRTLIKEIAGDDQTICNLHLKLSVLMGGLATIGLKNVKCVETYHNTYHHYHLEYFLMQPRIKKYITVSDTARQEMYDRFHTPRSKVIAVPNCVDREKLRCMVAKFGHEEEYLSIVSIGRMSYEKNFIVPVRAYATICNSRIRYTVIGDGPQRKEIEEAANGNTYIRFSGAVPRQTVLEELGAADVIVMPSLWEGRSILQLEAMAFDLPMILSDVPGLREPFGELPLKDGEKWRKCNFGYLVGVEDEGAYREVVQHFYDHKDQWVSMKETVKRTSISNNITQMVSDYIKVYYEVWEA